MAEKITSFPILPETPIAGDPTFQPTSNTGFSKEFRGDIYSSRGRFGNGTNYVDIGATEMKSANFVSGSDGWRILYNGDVEFNEGVFRGAVTVGSISIGTTPNWFRCDALGNIWSGNDTLAGAITNTFAVENTGALYCTSATISGATITTPTITSIQSGSEIAIQGWQTTLVFTASDYRTVGWSAGNDEVITLMDGTTYTFTAGNTSTMSALTYIYLDIGTSTTALQVTTTAATAVGAGKILVAVAKNNPDTTSKAEIQAFGGSATDTLILVDNLAANTASTNEFVANTANIKDAIITNAKVVTLEAGKITAGTINSQAIVIGITAAAGDCYIAGGTYNIAAWTATGGFILGIDDSDSDKEKFFIGDATTSVDWNVTTADTLTVKGSISITAGSGIANLADAGDLAVLNVIGNAYITDLNVSKLAAGTITSKSILLAVSAGTGDVEIRAGIATGDFANAGNASGFIIGIDDSDSDLAKSYIGDANHYTKFDGTDLISTGMKVVEKFTCGEEMAAGNAFTIGRQQDYDYTPSIVTVNDTYVDEDNADTDYSASTTLGIKDVTNFRQAAYIKFDITDMSDKFSQVLLRFYVDAVANTNPITVYRITADWTDSTTTWNAKPAVDANQTWGTVDPAGTGYKEIDITELFLLWKAGVYTNYGIRLSRGNLGQGGNTTITVRSEDSGDQLMFRSTSLQNTTTIWQCQSSQELSINNYMGVVLVGAAASSSALCQLSEIATGLSDLVAGNSVYAQANGDIAAGPSNNPLALGTAISTTAFRMEDIKRYARGVGDITISNLSEKLAIITPFRPMLFKIRATRIDSANLRYSVSDGSCRGNVAGQQGCVYHEYREGVAIVAGTSSTKIIYLEIAGGVDITAEVTFVENSGVTMTLAGAGTFYYEWEAFS